jgi:hypothetical protein
MEEKRCVAWQSDLEPRERAEVALARVYVNDFDHGTSGHLAYRLIDKLARKLDQANTDVPALRQGVEDQIAALGEYVTNVQADETNDPGIARAVAFLASTFAENLRAILSASVMETDLSGPLTLEPVGDLPEGAFQIPLDVQESA